jgi:hypothetical protein
MDLPGIQPRLGRSLLALIEPRLRGEFSRTRMNPAKVRFLFVHPWLEAFLVHSLPFGCAQGRLLAPRSPAMLAPQLTCGFGWPSLLPFLAPD